MYIIQEIQTNNGASAVSAAIAKSDKANAEATFLTKCAAACESSVEIHTVLCVDEHGNNCFGSPKYYEHISTDE